MLYLDTLCKDYTNGVIVETLDELRTFWLSCYRSNFRIIYRPTEKPQTIFPAVCDLVFLAKDMTFVVEECDTFFSGRETCDEFENVIRRGRKEGIELICVTQRPVGFGRMLTSQIDDFYIFRAKEPPDLRYFRDRLGVEVADQLPDLPRYHYLYTDDTTDKPVEVCKDDLIT